ncbi:Ig-like domain-containing protein [Photobacterium leiognathi]|uniref:Ig-like domain-containing protein n=1 Tax=Photobacterium leiognathi TaxID=553611 RepID=UPI00298200AA|nr:Ig-like domain-containing protein [Photobacterium leiognathi]
MNMQHKKTLLSICMMLGLSACGGGGGDDEAKNNVEVPDVSESVSGSYTKDDIKFNLTGVVSVVTTSELAEIPDTSSFSSKAISFNSYSAFSDDNAAKTNLFAVNDQGDMAPLVNLPGTAKFDYTVSSPDGKYLYALAGIDLYDYNNSNYDLLTNTNCSIFKIDTKTSDWSCLIENVIAETPSGYWGEVNDGRLKPLQVDQAGNVYFLSRSFEVLGDDNYKYINYDNSINQVLVKVTSDGVPKSITKDNEIISSFLVTKGNSLVYRSDKLNMIPDLNAEKLSTVELNSDSWSNGWYTVDDHQTVIYTPNYVNDSVGFAQPSKELAGAISKREINAYKFDSGWLKNIILGDDGYIYGVYSSSDTNNEGHWSEYAKLQRILPYSPDVIESVKIPEDSWWNYNQEMQVAKGYVYFIEEQKHDGYGKRDIIGATHLTNGTKITLLDGEWTDERYDIETWKLSGDYIYFTGLDQSSSTMISGKVDVAKLNEGKEESEYLTIKETASVSGDTLTILDMEVLRPVEPSNSGGYPRITEFVSSIEDIYSSTIKFNKWMDKESVSEGLNVTDSNGIEVSTMVVWLNRIAHLLYDTSENLETKSEPLKFGTDYKATISKNVKDVDGVSLEHEQADDADRTFEWKVRSESGVILSKEKYTSSLLENNNSVLKVFNGNLNVDFIKKSNYLDHTIEFTTKLSNEFYFKINGNGVMGYRDWSSKLYFYEYGSNEYLNLNNKIANFKINLSETYDDKVKFDITITSDDINPITITHYRNKADFNGSYYTDEGYVEYIGYTVVLDTYTSNGNYTGQNPAYDSVMLDDIKVIDNQNATVLIDEGFDVLPVVDGTDIYNFTSAL